MKGYTILNKENFDLFPIWKFDEERDLFFPVKIPDEIPDIEGDVSILSKLILKNKVELSGFITGIENVISVGIFTNTTPAYFNKNLADLAIQCFNDYSDFFKSKNINVFKDMFPLVYETRFDWEDYGYNNFTDSFNIPL